MSWLNKSLSHLQEISSTVSNFAEDVLAAEPPPLENGEDSSEIRKERDFYKAECERFRAAAAGHGSLEEKIEKDDLRRQNENLESRIEDLTNQVTNLSEELEDSIADNDKFAKRNSHLSKQNSTLLDKNKELSQDNESLQKSLEEVDAVHQEEIETLLAQREQLKSQLDPNELALTKAQADEIAKLKQEIELLNRTNSPAPSTPSPTPTDATPDFKLKMAKLQKQNKTKIQELLAKLKSSEERCSSYKEQCEALEAKCANSEMGALMLKETHAKNEMLIQNTEILELEIKNYEKELLSTKAQMDTQQEESAARMQKMKEFVDIVKNKKELLQKENETLKQQLEDTRAIAEELNDHRNIEKKLEFYMDKCQSLEAGLVMSDTAKKQLEEEKRKLHKEISVVLTRNAEFELEKKTLQVNLNVALETAQAQAAIQNEMESEITKLQDDKSELVETLSQEKKKIAELQSEFKKSSKKSKSVENELKAKVDSMESEMNSKVAAFTEQLEKAEAEILSYKTMAVDNDEAQASVAEGIAKLRAENDEKREQLKAQKDEFDVTTKKLQDRLDGSLQREKDLKNKLAESKKLVEQGEKEKSDLGKKLKKASKSDQVIEELRKQNTLLDKNFDARGHKIQRLETELVAAKEFVEEMSKENTHLTRKLDEYTEKYSDAQTSDLQEERNRYRETALRLENERGDLEQKLLDFERLSDEKQVAAAQMHKDHKEQIEVLIDQQNECVAEKNLEIQRLESEIAELMSKIGDLNAAIANSSSEAEQGDQIELLRNSHKEELKRRDSYVKKLEEEMEFLSKECQERRDTEDLIEKMAEEKEVATKSILDLEAMFKRKSNDLENSQVLLKMQEDQLYELQNEIRTVNQAKKEVSNKLEAAQKELAREKKANQRLKRDQEEDKKIRKLSGETELTNELKEQLENMSSAAKATEDQKAQLEEANALLFSKVNTLEEELSKERLKKWSAVRKVESSENESQDQTEGAQGEKPHELEVLREAESVMFAKIQYLEEELAKERASASRDEIASLKSDLSSLKERESSLFSKVGELEEDLSNERKNTDQLDTEIGELREQLSSTLEQLEDAEAAAQDAGSLLEQLRELEERNNKQQKKFDDVERITIKMREKGERLMAEKEKQIKSQQEKLRILQEKLDSTPGDRDDQNEQLEKMNEQLHSVLAEREHQYQAAVKALKRMDEQLRAMHEKEQEKLSDPENRLQEQIAHLEAEKEHLRHVIKESKKEAQELSNRLQETGQLLQIKSKQLDEFATKIDEAKRISDRQEMTQEAMNKLSHLVRAKDDEIEALNSKNQSLTEILRSDDSNSLINAKIEEIDSLNQQLIAHKQNYNQLEDTYRKVESSSSQVRSVFDQYHNACESERGELRALLTANDQLQQQAEETELELAKLRIIVAKIRAHPQANPTQQAAASESSLEINGDRDMLANSVKNLRERCSGLDATNIALKRDNDALRDQLMDRRDKWDNLEMVNKKMAAEITSRDERMIEMKESIDELKSSLIQKDQQLQGKGTIFYKQFK